MEKITNTDLAARFSPLLTPAIQKHAELQKQGILFAGSINNQVEDCFEKEMAISKIREAICWMNEALIRQVKDGD